MSEVIVKDGESLEQALKRFQRLSAGKKRQLRARREYLKPGVKAKLKSKEARKKAAKRNKRRR